MKAWCTLVAFVLAGCGAASDANEPQWEPPATGGASSLELSATATGGAASVVLPATGGARSTGGSRATGGKAATGGAVATGGKSATGGTSSTGGGTAECRCCADNTSGIGPSGQRKCGYDIDYHITVDTVICVVTDVQCTPKL